MKDDVSALLGPVVARFGLDLEAADVVAAGGRRVVRIVVDGDGPQGGGPLLDEIAAATKAISTALDGSAVLGERSYTLEVTSRGVSRPLELPRHWRRNTGRLVEVTLSAGERFRGRIRTSSEGEAVLEVDGHLRTVLLAEVRTAVVQAELRKSGSPDPKTPVPNADAPTSDREN